MCAIHLRHPFLLYRWWDTELDLIYQCIAWRLVGVIKSSLLQNMDNHKKWFVLCPCCRTLPSRVVFFKSISSSMVLWCPLRTIQKQWVSTSNPIPPKTKQKRKMFTLELQNAGVVQPPPALRFPLLPWNFCVKVVCDWMTCWHPCGSQCGYPRSVRRFREQQCLNEVLFLELMMNFHNQLSNESFNMCCRIDDHVGRFYWRDLEAIFTFFFRVLEIFANVPGRVASPFEGSPPDTSNWWWDMSGRALQSIMQCLVFAQVSFSQCVACARTLTVIVRKYENQPLHVVISDK